jgi:hypothetical protein
VNNALEVELPPKDRTSSGLRLRADETRAATDILTRQLHTILTDNGIQFAEQPRNRNAIYSRPMHFDMICEDNGIEQRLTKPNHP